MQRQRLIVVCGCGVEGWVEEAGLVLYHGEMNSKHYIEWLTQQLIPQLKRPTVILFDNASYHNKQKDKPPTSNNRKDDIRQWLGKCNIQQKTLTKTTVATHGGMKQYMETWIFSASPCSL